jgi:Helix-turn-helix domain
MKTLIAPKPGDDDGFLSAKDAATFLGLAQNTLAVWRCTKQRVIPFFKQGSGPRARIFYKKGDLIAWREAQRQT